MPDKLAISEARGHYSYPLISIIVPIYNTEKYLDQCVQSILTQTYTNLEVILVDDGSTDNSPEMCDEYARRDSRVRVIHQKNAGQALAHNAGLEAAHGELIAFVDSDDFILPEMYEKLYSLMITHDADVSLGELEPVDEDGNIIINPDSRMKMISEVLTNEQAIDRLLTNERYGFLWNRLHKAEIFKDIRFPAGNRHDDTASAHRIFWASRRTAVTDEAFYMYRRRANSVMGKIRHSKFNLKRVQDLAYIYNDRQHFFLEIGRPEWAEIALRNYVNIVKRAMRKVNYMQYREELSPLAHNAMNKLLHFGTFTDKFRAVKLVFIGLRSIFRPFINKEENE